MKKKLKFTSILIFLGFAVVFPGKRSLVVDAKQDANSDVSEPENRLPEIADLHHSKIGLGQRLSFGLEVIDEEGDDVRVELVGKPGSAKFDQNTLTVDWTPQPEEGDYGRFEIKVTELALRRDRPNRTVSKTFEIKIVKEKVALKVLPPTTLEVDAFVSVIDPDRLKASAKKWDIVSLLQRIAEIEAEKQITPGIGIQPTDGKKLFRDALKQLSILHKNRSIDPDSKGWDPVWEANNWNLITVRPRLNKKVFELRLVYFNEKAGEQAYLMPRMRIVRGDDAERPEEIRQKNNYIFAKLFHEAFFEGDSIKEFVASDKAAYGDALADFITRVLTYRDPEEPMLRANFAALPHNSRLGGGNAYDENGMYLYGDAWALGVMTVAPVERDGKTILAFTSPPIAGFVASIKPDVSNTKFKTTPAPVTDKASTSYKKGWETLYDAAHGTVFIPEEMPDGAVKKSNIDTTINARDYKFGYMVAETSLQDPRRRLFEEKGMTCIQCHVRNFDEGDYLMSVQKPREGLDNVVTRRIPRVFFIIIPTLHNGRNEYIHREEQEQVGNLKGVFRDYLGINVKMSSPLALDWVHNTKNGRN